MKKIATRADSMPATARLSLKNSLPAWLLLGMAALAVLSLWWAQDPHVQNLSDTLRKPGSLHWLGTDHLGRDQFARLGEALRVSLGLALASSLLAVLLGAGLGLLAAWRGGWAERACSLSADAVAAIPALLWVLLIAALAPGQKWALYSGLVLTAWVEFYRTVRPVARGALLGEQVQASRLLGFKAGYVLRWHVWPPLASSLLKLWSYAVASAVLAVAALGFVGIGLRPPTAELGLMMTEALPYFEEAPWLLAAPVVALLIAVMALQAAAKRWAGDTV